MECICYYSASTFKDHPLLSLLIPVIVILWIWFLLKMGERFGLDKFNNGDECLLTPEDFFNHAADPMNE